MSKPRPINWQDSLWAFHSFASHYPQKLDQLVSTYLDSGPWKIRFGRRGKAENEERPEDMRGDDLCRYNAADCRVTKPAWDALQRDLDKERHVYEHDLCLAELCSELHRVGIGVSMRRKRLLEKELQLVADRLKVGLRALAKDETFNPGSHDQVRRVLFETLGARKFAFSAVSGKASTGKATVEALRGEDSVVGQFCDMLIRRREATKIKNTYLNISSDTRDKSKRDDMIFDLSHSGKRPRAHFFWGPREQRDRKTSGGGHTVSGRLASRLQSCPRYNPNNLPDRVREIYVPMPGHEFVYFDVKQGEPRVGAYLSGDPERIKDTFGDVHTNYAKTLFPDVAARGWLDGDAVKDPAKGKPCRDLAKNMGLARDYKAEAQSVWEYLNAHRRDSDGRILYGELSLNTVNAIIAKSRLKYRVYEKFVDANLASVKRCGHIRDPILGRIRWLGYYPSITDVANFPIQSCLAAIMNLRTLYLSGSQRFRVWMAKNPEICERVSLPKWGAVKLARGTVLAAQIHDACMYDTPRSKVESVKEAVSRMWEGKIYLPGGELVLPVDMKTGKRWSDL